MAKITKCSLEFGMSDDTPLLPGVYAKCNEHAGPGEGCGTEFITEETDYIYGTWLAGGDGSMASGATMGWLIRCPCCGCKVRVRHPLVPELAGVKKQQSSACFVATCCFGELNAPEVVSLRRWRDEKLISSTTGRRFVAWYYSGYGNRAAEFIGGKPILRRLGRIVLRVFIRLAVR